MTLSNLRTGAAVAMIALTAACGGGGGGATGGGGGTTPTQKTVNSGNYLDAFWVMGIGSARIGIATEVIGIAMNQIIAAGDVSGTYACAGGGTFTLTSNGVARSSSFSNCRVSGSLAFNMVSGEVSSPNATTAVINNITYLTSGSFTFTNLLVDWGAGPEAFAGNSAITRAANLSVSGTGSLSVTRNSRADTYGNIVFSTSVPNASGLVETTSLTYAVNSPRFGSALAGNVDATTLRATAPDGSAVRGTPNANNGALYELFENFASGVAPVLTATLNNGDPLVVAAVNKALQ
jgi:hypothetical protein